MEIRILTDDSGYVLNVISPEAASLAARLRTLGRPNWLCEECVFDIPLAGDTGDALAFARDAARGSAADLNIVPRANRRKKLLAADMESTIIDCECVDELAAIAGVGREVAAITARTMKGEIDFAAALRERVALLKGLPLSALERVYEEHVRFNAGAKALVATMREHGAVTVLVSGGFAWFAERVARDAGFAAWSANVLLDDGEKLLGTVKEPILDREAKVRTLEGAAAQNGIAISDTLAVGDGANDVGMVQRAGLGVAWHAKPVLANAAAARIDHADLTALLYLQGYRSSEIASV
ncbi:MAG TPA: phosphoserine phosphatase SerB [Rhizomicrobium sp.]